MFVYLQSLLFSLNGYSRHLWNLESWKSLVSERVVQKCSFIQIVSKSGSCSLADDVAENHLFHLETVWEVMRKQLALACQIEEKLRTCMEILVATHSLPTEFCHNVYKRTKQNVLSPTNTSTAWNESLHVQNASFVGMIQILTDHTTNT